MAPSDSSPVFRKLGMISTGSMGRQMALMCAEHGIDVHFFDQAESNAAAQLLETAQTALPETAGTIVPETSYEQLCKRLRPLESSERSKPRLLVFSIPRGSVGDATIDSLLPFLDNEDVIVDCSNEHWRSTERRQKFLLERGGPHYVGCGVSRGGRRARHGVSISPGGSAEALGMVMPLLRMVAVKDGQGRACTAAVGPGGSGHYVKMVHDGIQEGLMGTLAEVWGLMTQGLGMGYQEVAKAWEVWGRKGAFRGDYLMSIGADINRMRDDDWKFLVTKSRDEVVQDFNDEEGMGTWLCEQSVALHVPAPTIMAAHLFRLASADASQRSAVRQAFNSQNQNNDSSNNQNLPPPQRISTPGNSAFLYDLHQSLYAAFLSTFIQGLHILHAADLYHSWKLDYSAIMTIWRGGCAIQSDFISDMLTEVFSSSANPFCTHTAPNPSSSTPKEPTTPTPTPSSLLTHPTLARSPPHTRLPAPQARPPRRHGRRHTRPRPLSDARVSEVQQRNGAADAVGGGAAGFLERAKG